jgi:hypothetical protein
MSPLRAPTSLRRSSQDSTRIDQPHKHVAWISRDRYQMHDIAVPRAGPTVPVLHHFNTIPSNVCQVIDQPGQLQYLVDIP